MADTSKYTPSKSNFSKELALYAEISRAVRAIDKVATSNLLKRRHTDISNLDKAMAKLNSDRETFLLNVDFNMALTDLNARKTAFRALQTVQISVIEDDRGGSTIQAHKDEFAIKIQKLHLKNHVDLRNMLVSKTYKVSCNPESKFAKKMQKLFPRA